MTIRFVARVVSHRLNTISPLGHSVPSAACNLSAIGSLVLQFGLLLHAPVALV
jgi:hypothetical protein